MVKPYEDTCALFRIREGTKNEFVAIGSDGNIRRWEETKGDEQLWLPVPTREGKVKFLTKQRGHAGELMSVGGNGNIVRWEATGKPEQVFKLVNPAAEGWWEIQEGTKGEQVGVGWDGSLVRWARSGDVDQRFKLEAWKAAPKPTLQEGECGPGEIGDVPRIESVDVDPPERSAVHLIAETLVPATVVTDPDFSNVLVQVERNPYYILRREQCWDRSGDRGFSRYHAGKTEVKFSKIFRYLVTGTKGHSSQSTLGFEFGVKGAYSRNSKLGGKVSAELSAKISRELKTVEYEEEKIEKETTFTYEQTFPIGDPFKLVGWTLIDVYSLLRMDRTPIAQWEIALDNTSFVDGFPRAPTVGYRGTVA